METSILIAKILSTIYLSYGVGLLVSRKYYSKMIDKFLDNSPALYLTGVFLVVLGWIMIYTHNTLRGDWTDIITVMSWIVLIKGILLLIFPTYLNGFKTVFGSKFMLVLVFVIGIIFANFGFLS